MNAVFTLRMALILAAVTSLALAPLAAEPLQNVVHFSPAVTKAYLGSPTLLRLPNRDILAGMDLFGPGAPVDETGAQYSLLFRSTDDGQSWDFVTSFQGSHWANLFWHRGAVFYLGCSRQGGAIVIRKSSDLGETWTQPLDAETGLLFPDGPEHRDPSYHTAPMPVVEHKGRLFRAFENWSPRDWPAGFRSLVISADVDSDLLKASSWRMSNELVYDQETDPPEFASGAEDLPGGKKAGWLEGNIVRAPDGKLRNILRVNSLPVVDRAAVIRVSDDGNALRFDPESGFIEFPGGMSKFTIRLDEESNRYWTIANGNTNPKNPRQRNVLSIYSSKDLRRWKHHETLLEDPSDFERIGNESKTGFQYIDFQFDGRDIIYLSRTAYKGANNYHDANYVTFHRIEGFRERYQ